VRDIKTIKRTAIVCIIFLKREKEMKKRMNRLNELVFNCNKCCRGGSVNSQWFASHYMIVFVLDMKDYI